MSGASLLLLLLVAESAAAKPTSQSSPPSISTCPSKTINYITATLAKQCLRTSWSSDRISASEAREKDSHKGDVITISESSSVPTDVPAGPVVSTSFTAGSVQAQMSPSQVLAASIGEPKASAAASFNATDDETRRSDEADSDPLSDNANFLSFEEWKAQMLKKAGQSPDHVSGSGSENKRGDAPRRPAGINNALDSLGEEGEIEIEFGGFVTPEAAPSAVPSPSQEAAENEAEGERKEDVPRKYSKDAGTTSKERTNFASFDCAATVLKTNKGCKGATSILIENKDSYMLNACAADNRFLIVELCNDILIDTIVLGNFEFFSSTFKNFRASVSDRYPVKIDKWKEIGTFEARNTRGVQPFLVENGLIWARYLRIEFLSHYGKEYYCPVSLLRVHGKTMMDDYRADMKASAGEGNDDDEVEDEPAEKVVAEQLKDSSALKTESTTMQTEGDKIAKVSPNWQDAPLIDKCPRQSLSSPLIQQAELFSSSCERSVRFCNVATVQVIKYWPVTLAKETASVRIGISSTPVLQKSPTKTKDSVIQKTSTIRTARDSPSIPSSTPKTTPVDSKVKEGETAESIESTEQSGKSSGKRTESGKPTKSQADQGTASASKVPSTPIPVTQESFFKSVHKRLLQLETNSTLSLQYIEEQSRILREAFTKVEKRQLSKTSNFLETLNTTVLSELREFRLQYDQIWQSTVLELSSQREQSQKEVTALSQRLTLLADEILWQKRIVYLQFGLILLCLCLVIFPRSQAPASSNFDLQGMVSRPTTSFARYLSFDSPPGTPSRPGSRYGLFSRRSTHLRATSQDTVSDDYDGAKAAPNIEYQLPTPTRSSEGDGRDGEALLSSPEADPMIRRAQSTPNLGKESDDLFDGSEEEEDGKEVVTNEDGPAG